MPLKDYQEIVSRLQKGLAKVFAQTPYILNLPDKAVACKVDPYYYIAFQPAFTQALARWSGMLPDTVMEALTKTGNLVTRPPEREHTLRLEVNWGGQPHEVEASFLAADFIDRALKFYAGLPAGLEVADIKILPGHKARLDELFTDKEPLKDFVYV